MPPAPVPTTRSGHGRVLRMTLDLVAPALHGATALLWRPAGLVERYPVYLSAMHAVVRASVPLMEAAARRCGQLASGDPLAEPLRRYLYEHIAEERHHDEWLVADLSATGVAGSGLLDAQPGTLIARMVGAQYYWIGHHHPVCLLGYIAALEANAPSPLLAEHLRAATGLPAAAFRTLHYHAVADAGHSDAVSALVDRLPLGAAQATAVNVSALSTVEGLVDLFSGLGGQR
jgi:hypothetical protein